MNKEKMNKKRKPGFEFKSGDLAWYKGKVYNIGRIDNHVYPICLIRGPRVSVNKIKQVIK